MPGAATSPTKAWLGPDHVLLVNRAFYVENYRRFFLRDIQAFIIRKTPTAKVWNILLGSGIGLMFLIAVAIGEFYPAIHVTWCVLLVFLLVNLALGPTCECHIRTAVNLQRMPMLSRLRTAERFLAVLARRINQAQGEMPADEVRRQAIERQRQPPSSPPAPWAATPGLRRSRVHYGGTMHFVLFSVLLAGCGLSLLDLIRHTTLAAVLVGMMLLGQIGFAIAAAVKQGGTDITAGLKVTVWLTVAYLCMVYLLAVGAPLATLGYELEVEPMTPLVLTPFALFIAICSGALGLIGFVQLSLFHSEYRRRRAAQGPPPTVERPREPEAPVHPERV